MQQMKPIPKGPAALVVADGYAARIATIGQSGDETTPIGQTLILSPEADAAPLLMTPVSVSDWQA
jgi:hypothetical protein